MEENMIIEEGGINLVGLEDDKSIIKVIGVGGGGGNAINYMYRQGICNVDFVVCNTDKDALNMSPVPIKIQLGEKGLGAGTKPEIGRQEAINSLPKIQEMLEGTEMVFITAGMGKGTGTGAAPVIAQAAKEMGILTIGIVTIPFLFEGRGKVERAIEGVEEMRKHVDAILIINNEKLKTLCADFTLSNAFAKADSVLTIAAKGIAEIITKTGYVNVDLNDVRTVMTNSGDAVMGSGTAAGPDRAVEAIRKSLDSPLLLSTNIQGAKKILLNISYGEEEVTMDEVGIITDYLEKQVGTDTEITFGTIPDETLGEELSVTMVATGFNLDAQTLSNHIQRQEKPKVVEQPVEQKKEVNVGAYYGNLSTNNNTRGGGYSETRPAQDAQPRTVILDMDDDSHVDRMESIPAYMRKRQGSEQSVAQEPIAQSEISRFSIGKETDGFELKDKNDYLHNSVD